MHLVESATVNNGKSNIAVPTKDLKSPRNVMPPPAENSPVDTSDVANDVESQYKESILQVWYKNLFT